MKTQRPPRNASILVSIGLLIVMLPLLFREYIQVSDFFRGLLMGMGITLEIAGLVWMGWGKKINTPVDKR